ncbi:MAG: hypothetical protein HW411_1138 [Gammaproteobacteria bacterium]|nr:hypothetical protein [Gammaproteobacteria bacterium]
MDVGSVDIVRNKYLPTYMDVLVPRVQDDVNGFTSVARGQESEATAESGYQRAA